MSYEQGFNIKKIKFWDHFSPNPDDSCDKTVAEQQAEKNSQKLFSCIQANAVSEKSIKRLEERGLIRPHDETF